MIVNMIWHVLQNVFKCYFVPLPRLIYIYWPIHFNVFFMKPSVNLILYVHYAMIKRKTFFFISALRSIRHGYRKRNLIFIEPLLWLRYDYEKDVLFLFHWDVHYGNIFLHDLTSLTTSLTCRKNSQTVYSPEKTCVT